MSALVKLSVEDEIAVVALEDREHKNTFAAPFVNALKHAFAAIDATPGVKVVIVHGYENYFCCGGTKDELIGLFESVRGGAARNGHGAVSLDDLMFFDLLLRCKVPVIAAMQGHAIGGGLAFGCFADIVLMAEESIYNAVFMKYGFTPGMGATLILPYRMGPALGTEMLFTARNYYGSELKGRGAPVQIVKRSEVIGRAFAIARELTEKPVLPLRLLKARMAHGVREGLAAAIAMERQMHEQTFAQPEVRARIEELFDR